MWPSPSSGWLSCWALPVTGLEERPEYADALRRAGAEKVLCGPYAENLTQVEGSAETYFVVATRAHSFDVECLTEIYKKRFRLRWYAGQPKPVGPCPPPAHRGRNCPGKGPKNSTLPLVWPSRHRQRRKLALSILAEIVEVKKLAVSRRKASARAAECAGCLHGTGGRLLSL